jgi:hypothetical protein
MLTTLDISISLKDASVTVFHSNFFPRSLMTIINTFDCRITGSFDRPHRPKKLRAESEIFAIATLVS